MGCTRAFKGATGIFLEGKSNTHILIKLAIPFQPLINHTYHNQKTSAESHLLGFRILGLKTKSRIPIFMVRGPSKYLFIILSPLLMRLQAPMSIDLWMLLSSQGHLVIFCTSCELGCYALLCMYRWAFGNVEEGFI